MTGFNIKGFIFAHYPEVIPREKELEKSISLLKKELKKEGKSFEIDSLFPLHMFYKKDLGGYLYVDNKKIIIKFNKIDITIHRDDENDLFIKYYDFLNIILCYIINQKSLYNLSTEDVVKNLIELCR